VAAGREWFIHTIYTVRSKDHGRRAIGKRSVEERHSLVAGGNGIAAPPSDDRPRARRSAAVAVVEAAPGATTEDIGADNGRGTNIMHLALDRAKRRAAGSGAELSAEGLDRRGLSVGGGGGEEEGAVALVVAGVVVGLLLTALLGAAVLALGHRLRRGAGGGKEGGAMQEALGGSVSRDPMLVVRMQDCHDSSEFVLRSSCISNLRSQRRLCDLDVVEVPQAAVLSTGTQLKAADSDSEVELGVWKNCGCSTHDDQTLHHNDVD
ncbi:unnamed protein product, partial [Boreogadus saida]